MADAIGFNVHRGIASNSANLLSHLLAARSNAYELEEALMMGDRRLGHNEALSILESITRSEPWRPLYTIQKVERVLFGWKYMFLLRNDVTYSNSEGYEVAFEMLVGDSGRIENSSGMLSASGGEEADGGAAAARRHK